jgi:hypothetical protein
MENFGILTTKIKIMNQSNKHIKRYGAVMLKTMLKPLYAMNTTQFAFCFLLTALVWNVGCITPAPTPNPLEGWKVLLSRDSDKLNQAIKDDCWDYIHKLPPEEKNSLTESSIWFFENSTGQHAVKFTIPVAGFIGDILWDHILIYDTNNKRIKTIKFKSGRSLS